jgi:hypothetical protein
MPLYRVHLRRATTRRWDWVQIITADNTGAAITRAYLAWAKAPLNTWVPRLKDCYSMIEEVDGVSIPADTLPVNVV